MECESRSSSTTASSVGCTMLSSCDDSHRPGLLESSRDNGEMQTGTSFIADDDIIDTTRTRTCLAVL
jgi:hypothetical protein